MFPSTTSSNPSSALFGFQSGNQNGSMFGNPTGTISGTPTMAFGQPSSSSLFSSPTPIGVPSISGLATSPNPFAIKSTPTFQQGSSNFRKPSVTSAQTSPFGTPSSSNSGTSIWTSTQTAPFGTPMSFNSGTSTMAFSSQPFGTPSSSNLATSAMTSAQTTPFGTPLSFNWGTSAITSAQTASFGTPLSFNSGTSTVTSSPFTFGVPLPFNSGTSAMTSAQTSPFAIPSSIKSGTSTAGGYQDTKAPEGVASNRGDMLKSISAMPAYSDKSHEELRWENYMSNGKGGFGIPSIKSTSSSLSPLSSSPFTNVSNIPWQTTTKTPTWNYTGPTSSPSTNTSATTATTPSFAFSPSTSLFTLSSSLTPTVPIFTSNTPNFSSSPNPFSATVSTSTSIIISPFAPNPFSTTVSAPLSNSINPFAPATTHTSPASTASLISFPSFSNISFPSPFTSPATQLSSLSPTSPAFTSYTPNFSFSPNTFYTTVSTTTSNIINPFAPKTTNTTPASTASPVSLATPLIFSTPTNSPFPTYQASTPASVNTNWCTPNTNSVTQLPSSQITSTPAAAGPFGVLPPRPQLSFQGSRLAPSIHYGIPSIPVKDKPAPVRYPVLTTRNLYRVSKLPLRKYDPKLSGPKTPYYSDTKEIPDFSFVPRENPRALVISPEMYQGRENMHEEKLSGSMRENDKDDSKAKACSDDPSKDKESSATIFDVPSKLQQPDYYTQPQISELEAKERAEPGFCRRVKNFVVGRHGYGSIKFLGMTDLRKVDLEAIIQFNNREVIVYMDENMKPPVGQGLNKPAEIMLLNIKCINKKTGMQYVDGTKIEKYTEVLKKKAVTNGAEFVSYDPVEGEWKFRVQHF